MENQVEIAVLQTKVDALIEKQKELTARVRANEKVVAAVTLLGTVVLAVIGAGYFAPKAEACSPPLDGSEFTCPPHDGVLEKPVAVSIPEEEEDIPEYYSNRVTLYDSRFDVAHMGHSFPTGEWIQKIREWESNKSRPPVDESINNALGDFYWEDQHGGNDSTEQEELLQLSSDGDS